MVICFPQIRNIPSAYNKHVTGFGSFTAAKYGTRCPAHEYSTFGVVPYSCAGHLVPYVAAVKNLIPLRLFINAHSICECRSRGAIRCPIWNTSHTADFMIYVRGDATLTIGPYGSAGMCIINYAPPQINVIMTLGIVWLFHNIAWFLHNRQCM